MGIWRSPLWRDVPFAGAFAVVERQGECGSKTAGMHCFPRLYGVSQPMNEACVSGSVFFLVFSFVAFSSARFRATLISTSRSYILKIQSFRLIVECFRELYPQKHPKSSLLDPLSNVLEGHTHKNIRNPLF